MSDGKVGVHVEMEDGEGWKWIGGATTTEGLHEVIAEYAGMPNPIRVALPVFEYGTGGAEGAEADYSLLSRAEKIEIRNRVMAILRGHGLSFSLIGGIFGVSKQRVHQILTALKEGER